MPSKQTPVNHAPEIIRLTFDWVREVTNNGFIVGTVRATDRDSDSLTYELVDDADGRFYMDGDDLRVLDGSRFNDQTSPTHTVRVRVTDEHGLWAEKEFVVRVMDRDGNPTPPNQAPTDVVLHGNVVNENSLPTSAIGYLTADDPDGNPVTYELVNNAGGRFQLQNEMITVKDGSLLDYEVASSHEITVRVTDVYGLSTLKTFTIHVKDVAEAPPSLPPIDIVLSDTIVAENAANGTQIGTVIVVDPDQGDAFNLELVDNAQGRFALVNGRLVVADGSRLDFETEPAHTIILRATDASGHVIQKAFSIVLIDMDEVGTPLPQPVIIGTEGYDVLFAPDSNDYTILGLGGNDTLAGHDGDDTLAGGAGGDTYLADLRYGDHDVIFDVDGFDRLMIDTAASHLRFVRNAETNSLLISHRDNPSTLEIKGYFDTLNENGHIEEIVFASGDTWGLDDVLRALEGNPPPENRAPTDIVPCDSEKVSYWTSRHNGLTA